MSHSEEKLGADYMTRSHPIFRLAGNASLRVRRRAYEWFSAAAGGIAGKTILDRGAMPDTLPVDGNSLTRWMPEDGAAVLAASPVDISHLPSAISDLEIVAWPPEEHIERRVDIVVSSSVVQHVGGREAQVAYLGSLASLAGSLFLTTPNRRHWLEFHTKLPFLHWLPKPLRRRILVALGLTFWASEINPNLLTRTELDALLDEAIGGRRGLHVRRWFETRFLGQVSNVAALAAWPPRIR